jgi:hypothetical protein
MALLDPRASLEDVLNCLRQSGEPSPHRRSEDIPMESLLGTMALLEPDLMQLVSPTQPQAQVVYDKFDSHRRQG